MKKVTLLFGCALLFIIVGNSTIAAEKKSTYEAEKVQELLVNAEGKKWTKSKLADKKYILLYFSAHWCPPCRAFTPKLVNFYNEKKQGDFEVIFISSDRNKKAMQAYMKETSMPWPAIQFDKIKKSNLRSYAGNGIPCLVLLDQTGKVLSDSFAGETYLGPGKVLKALKKLLADTKKAEPKKEKTPAKQK